MSGQSLVMFVSVIAIAVAANRAEDTSLSKPSPRAPASIANHKEHGFVQKDLLKRTHKLRGPVGAAVEMVGAPPEAAGDVFVLKGLVSAESALENIEFSWVLPAGVEIVNGQVSSVISAISEDRPFETQITLRQVSTKNARVVFKIRGHDAGMKFSDSAQYHTVNQERIEASRKALQKSTDEYVREEKRLKIFH